MPRAQFAGLIVIVVLALCLIVFGAWRLFSLQPDCAVVYRMVDGHSLTLHVFAAKPAGDRERPPALLLFHGGAWQFGDARQFFGQCRFFSRRGLTCVSAEYRVASVHATDARAALDDARAAFDYLVDHAEALKIDPNRIAVGGGSAGGHLAAALGVGLRDAAGADRRPAASILYNPMLDLAPGMPDHELVEDFWHDVSPLQRVDQRTPPTLILLGTHDREVSVATVQAYCAAVSANGTRCEIELYPGAEHGFFNPDVEQGRFHNATNARVTDFFYDLGYPLVESDLEATRLFRAK